MEKLYSEIEILKTANIRKREVGKLNPSTFLLSSIEIIFFKKKKSSNIMPIPSIPATNFR